ncbi:MAG: hypothetical protein MJ219_00670 [Mycoplasmoidaceae bacterium]|nr:hypothetical protein [Mycoplasmoidaceae bacterium]
MKKLKILPTPTTVSLISISVPLVSCTRTLAHPIPLEFLVIDDSNTLIGFDENHQRANQMGNYNILTIPKDVVQLKTECFNAQLDQEPIYDAPTVIKEINFEEGCQCLRFDNQFREFKGTNFNFLPNLEKVVFPPKYQHTKDQNLFKDCPRLTLLDISHIETDIASERAVAM